MQTEVLASQFNCCSQSLTWHSFSEFDCYCAFLAVETHDFSDETVLSVFQNHFSPNDLGCLRDGFCVCKLD